MASDLQAPPDRGASSFVYPPTSANLRWFAEALRRGDLVGIPTETVYGLAAHALLPEACRGIFELKGRPLLDPLIVHIAHQEQLKDLAEVSVQAEEVLKQFWPGPLTLVLPKRSCVPDIVTAGLPTVAVRMPGHPVARELLGYCEFPLAAPSANPFGYISPTSASHVRDSFGGRLPFIIDGGDCSIGLESTIIDLSHPEQPAILRPGAISAAELSAALGTEVAYTGPQKVTAILAPGMLDKHYSPHKCLRLFSILDVPPPSADTARIFFARPSEPQKNDYWFSENGDLSEVATKLFRLLRELDKGPHQKLLCEVPHMAPAGDLAAAIGDRLHRAAAKSKS